jgi:hypothetical protein
MLGMGYLVVMVVQSGFMEKLCKGGDVHSLSSFPLAVREPLLDFLHLPAVPIRIFKRGKGKVGTTRRFANSEGVSLRISAFVAFQSATQMSRL